MLDFSGGKLFLEKLQQIKWVPVGHPLKPRMTTSSLSHSLSQAECLGEGIGFTLSN